MLAEAITDQKRFVRGEQWLRARYWLRARDHKHHGPWRIMMIAGPSPSEEINCIRELMPQAHITAVDINQANVLAAIDAGADDAIQCDISKFEVVQEQFSQRTCLPALIPDEPFDVICLDMTGSANDWLKRVAQVYFRESLNAQGVMILTFSYGRDVLEAIHAEWNRAIDSELRRGYVFDRPTQHLKNLPEPIAARLWFVLRSISRQLEHCVQYRGNKMPMLSCLAVKKSSGLPPAKLIVIEPDDYATAVASENLGNVYACTAERIAELRGIKKHTLAARKAVQTRQKKLEQAQREIPLLAYVKGGNAA